MITCWICRRPYCKVNSCSMGNREVRRKHKKLQEEGRILRNLMIWNKLDLMWINRQDINQVKIKQKIDWIDELIWFSFRFFNLKVLFLQSRQVYLFNRHNLRIINHHWLIRLISIINCLKRFIINLIYNISMNLNHQHISKKN